MTGNRCGCRERESYSLENKNVVINKINRFVNIEKDRIL